MNTHNENISCHVCSVSTEAIIDAAVGWFLGEDLILCPRCAAHQREMKMQIMTYSENDDTSDWEWLESTEALQIDYFDNDLRSMEGEELDNHILVNVTAAVDELHEALAENPSWKPWSSEVGVLNKEAYKGELVDAMHFLANLIILGKISEKEFWDAYREKQQRNRDRMSKAGGYQASKNKCPKCKRELDKPGAYKHLNQQYYQDGDKHKLKNILECTGCGEKFDYDIEVGESLPAGRGV